MKLLLDTHAILWWLDDDAQLGPETHALIQDPANVSVVSMVFMWEMAVKVWIGKLTPDLRTMFSTLKAQGFTLLNIEAAQLKTLIDLPMHHRDPFDHLLIAQAITEGATFVSADRRTALYPVAHLSCWVSLAPPQCPPARATLRRRTCRATRRRNRPFSVCRGRGPGRRR